MVLTGNIRNKPLGIPLLVVAQPATTLEP